MCVGFDPISYVEAKKKVTWKDVKLRLQLEGAYIKPYDQDADGYIDPDKVNQLLFQNIATNVIPISDNTYSLGSATNRWKYLHISSQIVLGDGSTLTSLAPIDATVSVANSEVSLFNLTDVGVYSGWILLPAVDATWTVRMYLNSETTPWDEISVTTTSTSSFNDRVIYVNRLTVDGSIVTNIKITIVSNQSTAYNVTARLLQLR